MAEPLGCSPETIKALKSKNLINKKLFKMLKMTMPWGRIKQGGESGHGAPWCPTLCKPMDYSPPGSSFHGIFQAKILEWVAISFHRRSS